MENKIKKETATLSLTYSLDVTDIDCASVFDRVGVLPVLNSLVFRRPDGRRFKLNLKTNISSSLFGIREENKTCLFCQTYQDLTIDSIDDFKFIDNYDENVLIGLMRNVSVYTGEIASPEESIIIESLKASVRYVTEYKDFKIVDSNKVKLKYLEVKDSSGQVFCVVR